MKNNNSTAPVLTSDGSVCTIGEVKINLHQNIDYKSATEKRASIGKVVAMKHPGHRAADKSSVWMRIVDSQDTNQSEWVSIPLWYEQYKAGLFGSPIKAVEDDSTEPEDTDLPF